MGRFLKNLGAFLATGAGILACTFFTVAMLFDARFVGPVLKPFFFAGSVFWGLLALTGVKLWRDGKRRFLDDESARYKLTLEQIARRNGGRVTALEFATAAGIDVEPAREYLNLLVGYGELTSELSEQNVHYYQLASFGATLAPPPFPPPPPPPVAEDRRRARGGRPMESA